MDFLSSDSNLQLKYFTQNLNIYPLCYYCPHEPAL